MTTLGARGCPSLEGVPGPAAPGAPGPPALMLPCCALNCGPAAKDPEAGCWPGCSEAPVPKGVSTAGWILLRASVSWVCDEEGVA